MKQIPNTENPLVLRTDWNNDSAWETICSIVQEPTEDDFHAYVEFVDDAEYAGITKEQLLQLVPANYTHTFIIIADQTTMLPPDYPLLIVDLYASPGRTFRATPSQIQGIENNLSIANMDFAEFADSVDADGIFRGFSDA